MVIMQFEVVPLFSFLLKSVSRKELSIDLKASIEGQYSSARLEPAFLTWWHGTRIELVYFELVSLSEQKYTAYEHFQETGSYGTKKKQTKYEQQNRLHMSFRGSFFIWIINLWSALPFAIRSEVKLVPFKKKLKSFFCNRLSSGFNRDDIRSYKLVCPKCRRADTATRCSF